MAVYTIPGPNSGCVCDVTPALRYAEETTKVFVLDPGDGKLEWAVPSQKLQPGWEGTPAVMTGRVVCVLIISMVPISVLPLGK